MKKTKVIIPALGILLLSTAASVTGTVAWFSMNSQVTAQGMFVQAKAEYGIVISNAIDGEFKEVANSLITDVAQLKPGSTADFSTWLASTSTASATANTQQAYTAGQAWSKVADPEHDGEYIITVGNYIAHSFYLRSSTDSDIALTSLDVASVKVTIKDSENAAAQELSKALRVGVKFVGSTVDPIIYAPVTGHDANNLIQPAVGDYTADGRINVAPKEYNVKALDTSITTLPKKSGTALLATVYVWYEGEDSHCISDNIIPNLEQLSISVNFSYTAAN